MAKPTFSSVIAGKSDNKPGNNSEVYQVLTTIKRGTKTTMAPPPPQAPKK